MENHCLSRVGTLVYIPSLRTLCPTALYQTELSCVGSGLMFMVDGFRAHLASDGQGEGTVGQP